MSRQYLLNHCRLETQDLDEARASVNKLWERHSSYLRRGQTYGVRWHQAELAGTSLSFLSNSSALHVDNVVGQKYHLSFCETGGAMHHVEGREVVSSAANMVIHTPGQDLRIDLEPYQALILSFDATYAEKMLRRRGLRVPTPDAWPAALPSEVPSVATLRSLCQWMGRELDRTASHLPNSPSVQAGLERILMTMFIDALTEFQPPVTRERGQLGAPQLKLIDEWLDSNYAEMISVDDLATVAGVSVRALQAAFRRVRGYTPQQAIQRRRLAAARKLLLAPEPLTTVTQVALDCGFFHLGRFAAAYGATYGETPSQTLVASKARCFGPSRLGTESARHHRSAQVTDRFEAADPAATTASGATSPAI